MRTVPSIVVLCLALSAPGLQESAKSLTQRHMDEVVLETALLSLLPKTPSTEEKNAKRQLILPQATWKKDGKRLDFMDRLDRDIVYFEIFEKTVEALKAIKLSIEDGPETAVPDLMPLSKMNLDGRIVVTTAPFSRYWQTATDRNGKRGQIREWVEVGAPCYSRDSRHAFVPVHLNEGVGAGNFGTGSLITITGWFLSKDANGVWRVVCTEPLVSN